MPIVNGQAIPRTPRLPSLPMMPGARPAVMPPGSSSEQHRVYPRGFTPAKVHGPWGDTSVPNTGQSYAPPAPPQGQFSLPPSPLAGAIPGNIGGQHQLPQSFAGPGMSTPMQGHAPAPGYAPPSIPPTQMPTGPYQSGPLPAAPQPLPGRAPVPGETVSPGGVNLAPHPLVGNSPGFDAAIGSFQAQEAARDALHQRNMGAYSSMGRPVGYQPPNVTAQGGINDQVAAHQHQQMLNNLSVSDANQLRLGGARPTDADPLPAPPTLDHNSRFYAGRGVNENTDTGSTYVKTGAGSTLLGANAVASLEKQGFKPADLQPDSPYKVQAQRALDAINQASTSRLASERASAGGGTSRASQYAQEQRDRRTLSQARRQGVGAESPAASSAAARETGRQEDLRNRLAGITSPGGGIARGFGKAIKNASDFTKTPVGKAFEDAFVGTGRPFHDRGSSGVLNLLQKNVGRMDRKELEGLSDWIDTHPELSRENSPHLAQVKQMIGARGGSRNKPVASKPTPLPPPPALGGIPYPQGAPDYSHTVSSGPY